MKLLKLKYHIKAFFKKLGYKIIYGSKLKIGSKTTWRANFHIAIEGGRVVIGKNCFFNNGVSINSLESVEIGDGTITGANVHIYDHNHQWKDTDASIKEQGYTTSPTVIGKHCWLGTNVVVLKGAHIGDNCVIGAGVVVKGDVPAGSVIIKDTK